MSAASGGTLNQEARRFVSTLQTQASFNVPDLSTYCQTPEYESINPAFCNALVGTGNAGFLTDLYQAFLFREPDLTAKEGTILLTVFDGFGFGGSPVTQSAVMGVPVTGEYATTNMRSRDDGTTSTRTTTRPFFRDRQGRIRQERGDIVTITDPVAGVRYVLKRKTRRHTGSCSRRKLATSHLPVGGRT